MSSIFSMVKENKKRGKWTERNMKYALNAVLVENCSIREASKKFNVPKSTLGIRIKLLKSGQEINLAPYTGDYEKTFTESEEKILFDHIINSVNQSKPMTKGEFLKLSYQYAEHLKLKHRFNKNKQMAGKSFYYNFMKRNSHLGIRTTESTSLQTSNYDAADCYNFFNKCELMEQYSLSEKVLSDVISWLGDHSCVPTETPNSVPQAENKRPSVITSARSPT